MREPVLSLRGISKRYGPLEVLKNVDLDVYAGEVVALLGENGAGKSTLSGIIAGSREPSQGTMTWLGQPYAPASPREAIDKGVVLIHQELKLLPELSIAENVFIGRWPMKNGKVDRAEMVRRAQEQLARLNLHIPASRKVAGLSTANQQLIEIAKALALDAKLLILDEPTAALGGAETQALFEQVRKLRAEGLVSSTFRTEWRRSDKSPTGSSSCVMENGSTNSLIVLRPYAPSWRAWSAVRWSACSLPYRRPAKRSCSRSKD